MNPVKAMVENTIVDPLPELGIQRNSILVIFGQRTSPSQSCLPCGLAFCTGIQRALNLLEQTEFPLE